jgi:hypothetical protein
MTSITGTGLSVSDGDLVFTGGDLATVTGAANLLQALRLRVLTPLGSDRYDTRYGLDTRAVFTQPLGVQAARDVLRLNLVRTLGTDRRVQEVRDVRIVDDAQSRRSRVFSATVQLVAADSTPATLTVGIGA